jgi:alginate O-acetyltransferase complex protein AlgI
MRRLIVGLAKKILIANALGELCDVFRASDDKSVLFYWLYAIAFTLHIYFDFSGYSDMAIGMGKIFGFRFLENFDYPYISTSVTEFWRRWHMSLGSWFRDYVYIPLGGNRVSNFKRFRNIFVVWMLTGFWHGAAWNFIVWGLYFAVLLIIEKLWLKKYLDKSKVLSHIYVMFLVIILPSQLCAYSLSMREYHYPSLHI